MGVWESKLHTELWNKLGLGNTCGAFPGNASCLHTSVDKARSPTLLMALHSKSVRLSRSELRNSEVLVSLTSSVSACLHPHCGGRFQTGFFRNRCSLLSMEAIKL